MIINSSQYFDIFNWIFLDKLLDKFYEKTYNNRIKNYKFKWKKLLGLFKLLSCGSGKKYKHCCGKNV